MRKALIRLHLWAGLVTGMPLAIVGVSGSVLVFAAEFERWWRPEISYVQPRGDAKTLDELRASVERANPGQKVVGVTLPTDVTHSAILMTRNRVYHYVDPYTGAILGDQPLDSLLRRVMFLVHTQMLAGPIGNAIVIMSTALAVVMTVTGLILWWPRKILVPKVRVGWKRINFDLHNVFGFYATAVLLPLAVTGVVIALEGTEWFARVAKLPPPERPPQSQVVTDGVPVSLERAADVGRRTLPGARVTYLALGGTPSAPLTVYAKFPEDPGDPGKSRVFVDQYSGEVLRVKSTRDATSVGHVLDLTEPIHFGDVFGLPSQIAVFIVGLFLTGQAVSGVLIWWNTRRT